MLKNFQVFYFYLEILLVFDFSFPIFSNLRQVPCQFNFLNLVKMNLTNSGVFLQFVKYNSTIFASYNIKTGQFIARNQIISLNNYLQEIVFTVISKKYNFSTIRTRAQSRDSKSFCSTSSTYFLNK